MHSRQIALASADGQNMGGHLARSVAFIVVEVAEGNIVSRTIRNRGNGQCGSHKMFLELAEGCSAVICGGISQAAFDLLQSHGIEPVVAASSLPVEEAISAYLAGTLPRSTERVCLCH